MNSKIYDKTTYSQIQTYCNENNISDIEDFIFRCFKQGFDINRYGFLGKTQDIIEKEIIIEKKIEIPVEVIKEVEKIVYITNTENEKNLTERITKLDEESKKFSTKIDELELERQNFSTKTQEMEKNFHYSLSKKDEELDELRRILDDDQSKRLQETLQKLRKELVEKNKKIEELEKINQNPIKANLMNGSKLI
jgi:predicted RNase H-like nuclease (RuvC/YqgF family)